MIKAIYNDDPSLYDADYPSQKDHEVPHILVFDDNGPYLHLCSVDSAAAGRSVYTAECLTKHKPTYHYTQGPADHIKVRVSDLDAQTATWGSYKVLICSNCARAWRQKIIDNAVKKNDSKEKIKFQYVNDDPNDASFQLGKCMADIHSASKSLDRALELLWGDKK